MSPLTSLRGSSSTMGGTQPWRFLRSPMTLAAVAVAAGGLAACGGDGGGDSSEAPTGSVVDEGAQQEATAAAREKELAARARRLIALARTPQEGKSRKEQLRIANAEAQLGVIAGQSLSAVRPLVRALEQRDYELIADLAGFYVALGKPGSETILAETVARLYPTGEYSALPIELLGSGNDKLDRKVTEALESAGFTVSGEPGFTGNSWGSSGAYGEPPVAPGVPAIPEASPTP